MSPSFPSRRLADPCSVASPHAIDLPVMKPCSLGHFDGIWQVTYPFSCGFRRQWVGVRFSEPSPKTDETALLQEFNVDRGVGDDALIGEALAVTGAARPKPFLVYSQYIDT